MKTDRLQGIIINSYSDLPNPPKHSKHFKNYVFQKYNGLIKRLSHRDNITKGEHGLRAAELDDLVKRFRSR